MPFDLPEAESELIAGYHAEYSGMKFSMFFIAEYANVLTASALFVSLFFGGWDIPFTRWDNAGPATVTKSLLTVAMFGFKTYSCVLFYIWIRWTLPRFRYDQLMSLGWKFMLPLALVYIVIVASAILGLDAAGVARTGWAFKGAMGSINLVLLILLFFVIDRGRLISPASSRIDRERVARIRRATDTRSTLGSGETH